MSPDDARHGTPSGYRVHLTHGQDPCVACREAHNRYERHRKYDEQLGRPRIMPSLGLQRRFRALQRLGWSSRIISSVAGYPTDRNLQYALTHEECHRKTWLAVAHAYDLLSMKLPPERTGKEKWSASRTRGHAERMGWPPPLAWDNIDDPNEEPKGALFGAGQARDTWVSRLRAGELDVTADEWIERILGGQRPEPHWPDRSIRVEIVAKWSRRTGHSLAELTRLTGWKPERYKEAA